SYDYGEGEFEGEVLIGQKGYPIYVANFDFSADPIRNYVSEKISTLSALPNCFFSYNPTGTTYNTGLFTVFAKISGNIYIGFEVGHWLNMADLVYLDYWRLVKAN